MRKLTFIFILFISLFLACSKDKDIIENETLSCDIPVSISSDSIFRYAYYCESENPLTLFIYTPENWESEADLPCIIYFHGALADADQYAMQCRHFAKRGMVAISVNHRFLLTNLYNKNGLKDGHTAVRWVKENFSSLGVDTSKIAVSGSSGGGAVALSCYLSQDFNHFTDDKSISIKPDVFVVTNPDLIDFLELPEDASDHPPTIFFQGDTDDLTPLEDLESYRNLALSRGAAEMELVVYPGRGHGFFNYRVSVEDYEDTLLRADSFLVEHGYLTGYIDRSFL